MDEKEYRKKWYLANQEKTIEKSKKWRKENKEKNKETNKKYREENQNKIKKWREENKEHVKEWRKQYREKNRHKISEYERSKRNSDPLYKLKANIRRTIWTALKTKGYTKNSRTFEILGCSFKDFKKYIESLWESWMSWDNYGLYNGKSNYGWDIDHVIPLSRANNEDDIKKLNHFKNLQPLCSYINRDVKKNITTSNIL